MERSFERENPLIIIELPTLKNRLHNLIDNHLTKIGVPANNFADDTMDYIIKLSKDTKLSEYKKNTIKQAVVNCISLIETIRPNLPNDLKVKIITPSLELLRRTAQEISESSFSIETAVKEYYPDKPGLNRK